MQCMFIEAGNSISNPPACDCHFHVFNAGESASETRYVPEYTASLNDWESQAAAARVKRGIVVQPSFLGINNQLLLETLVSKPDDLRGVAVVSESVSGRELRHLYAGGVRGIRLNLMGHARDEEAIRELPSSWWSGLLAAGLHLELHSEIGRIASLLPLIPHDIVVVLDHFAKPQAARLTDATVVAVCERVRAGSETYITLSGAYRLGAADALEQSTRSEALATLWRDMLGRDRLLWGSDWPCTNYESKGDYGTLREQLASWLPDSADQTAALSTNPDRLYWRNRSTA